jgi:hypothetical protein
MMGLCIPLQQNKTKQPQASLASVASLNGPWTCKVRATVCRAFAKQIKIKFKQNYHLVTSYGNNSNVIQISCAIFVNCEVKAKHAYNVIRPLEYQLSCSSSSVWQPESSVKTTFRRCGEVVFTSPRGCFPLGMVSYIYPVYYLWLISPGEHLMVRSAVSSRPDGGASCSSAVQCSAVQCSAVQPPQSAPDGAIFHPHGGSSHVWSDAVG